MQRGTDLAALEEAAVDGLKVADGDGQRIVAPGPVVQCDYRQEDEELRRPYHIESCSEPDMPSSALFHARCSAVRIDNMRWGANMRGPPQEVLPVVAVETFQVRFGLGA